MKTSIDNDILRLAIPNIISNITVPLLSMVDMAIIGHLSLQVYIGAIATVTLIFNFMYWSFSFLRMGTSGFTAQAYGAQNNQEIPVILLRSLTIALIGGIVIVGLQGLIFDIAFLAIKPGADVTYHARTYFDIYIWSAPAVLAMYAFSGWFVGMQDARTPMYIVIVTNIINITLSLLFVYKMQMNIEGVAWGSLIAQYSGVVMAFVIWYFKYREIRINLDFDRLRNIKGMIPFFKVNSNIFIRTMLLIAVTTFFTSISARMGDTILAANALLMQFFTLFSYMMDGFAYAAEALTGRFVGAKEIPRLHQLIRRLFVWGIGLVLLFTLTYYLFTDQILGLLTNKEDIIAVCKEYKIWILLIPIAGFSAFLWDGIFIGVMASRQMRNSMFIAAASFFLIYYSFTSYWGNNALWLSFIIYLAIRGIVQYYMYRNFRINVEKNRFP